MRFCKEHWDQLRGAIKLRGLGHRVLKGPPKTVEEATSDPLIVAHNDVLAAAIDRLGGERMKAAGKEECPVCMMDDGGVINRVADHVARIFKEPTVTLDPRVAEILQ
jgi:hypothetical protein